MLKMCSPLIFYVNGKRVVDGNPDPEETLLTYLRDKLRLCGTKLGCGEGGCGSCTVMISKINRITNEISHLAVNACLTPICSIHGLAITTVEGIGNTKTKLHPVQERIAKSHGTQCGFCTPGMVMSMYALIRSKPKLSMNDLEIALKGNLCRCTGYRPIIDGYRTFVDGNCAMGDNCCKNQKAENNSVIESNEYTPYDQSQEPIFPPELKMSKVLDGQSLIFKNSKVSWFRPIHIKEILEIKKNIPNVKIVNGNTEIGVEIKMNRSFFPFYACSSQIKEMKQITSSESGLKIGAAVTLMEMELKLLEEIEKLPECKTRIFKEIIKILSVFGSKQIRNVASVGGNVMTGNLIADLIPIFTVTEIELEVISLNHGTRKIKMGKINHKNIIKPDEILLSILIPRTEDNQYVVAYKQSRRRDVDQSIINYAINVVFNHKSDVIEKINLSFGGLTPSIPYSIPSKTCYSVIGKKWNSETLEYLNDGLINELCSDPAMIDGMILYRKTLVLSLMFKAYLHISQELEIHLKNRIFISKSEISGSKPFQTCVLKSSQFYEKSPNSQNPNDLIGRPHIHMSAYKQTTGEAIFVDDIPHIKNELYLSFVLSTKAHAKIVSIDSSEAMKQSGVRAFFCSKDLTLEQNMTGEVFKDEQFFRSETVTAHGQIIGAIIADNRKIAQQTAKMVRVTYEEISPIIITIEDAIKHKSFFSGYPIEMIKGDIVKSFNESDHVSEGSCRIGGQEHFYLETQVSLAIPKDSDELEIYSSSQELNQMQISIAKVLEIPASKVVAKVKRIGGGFGGKEIKSILIGVPCALAAYRLQRPVRCMLDRDEDMIMTGGRNPFLINYKIGFNKNGKINGCEVDVYVNAGYSLGLSGGVLEHALYHLDNTYMLQNVKFTGWVCKTNIHSNTAFRGFGAPQAMFASEHIVRQISMELNMELTKVMELNMYKNHELTFYDQSLTESKLEKCWDEVLKNSNYFQRIKLVEKFNKENRWRKRGLSIVPTKYGPFLDLHLNQAGALVNVYTDGSVLISHGGIEMGQGLHTKMMQVASRALNIPIEMIHTSETGTDKIPNASVTAGSLSSDLNGMAIINACNILLERLDPFKIKFPNNNWNFWIQQAYMDRISLSATGYYSTPDISTPDRKHNYFVYGSAVSEVEIDCLTGDHQVMRTDIVMDLGSSLNPAIDIGQIEGGFIQGYGLFTLEEMIYSSTGEVYSKGPGTYKIPGFSDIPKELNVSILKGSSNPRAIYSSKGVGEPPLFLASTIFFAIKEAIISARKERNLSLKFEFNSPATSERIRMACFDGFTAQSHKLEGDISAPWNVIP